MRTLRLLEVQNVQKTYRSKFSGQEVQALKGVSFSVEEGEFIAVMGESGSGKTTLLNILAALDSPTMGSVCLDGVDMTEIRPNRLSAYRRQNIGFIFQNYNLLDTFSNKDNILMPLVLNQERYADMEPKLADVSARLHLDGLLKKFPYEVSGGQKQRIAAARALITQPKILLADEPTGALDSKNSQELLELMAELNTTGQTILMVTHSTTAASYASRVLFIQDGKIFHQVYRGNRSQQQMFQIISDTLSLMASGGSHD